MGPRQENLSSPPPCLLMCPGGGGIAEALWAPPGVSFICPCYSRDSLRTDTPVKLF